MFQDRKPTFHARSDQKKVNTLLLTSSDTTTPAMIKHFSVRHCGVVMVTIVVVTMFNKHKADGLLVLSKAQPLLTIVASWAAWSERGILHHT